MKPWSAATGGRPGTRWLRLGGIAAAAAGAWLLWGAGPVSADAVHGPYSLTTNQCATCHRTHTAQGRNALVTAEQPELCLTCHDGTGAGQDVQRHYDLAGGANDATTRTYFSHDPSSAGHVLAIDDEFGGVFDRHSTCTDCHDAHSARAGLSSQDTVSTPWVPSAALKGVSGVVLTHASTPGDPPTYEFRDGQSAFIGAEYELCLKCHSGFTDMPRNRDFPASQYELDKGIEVNPANASFHPVAAPGTNRTSKMALSLSLPGTSPYKRWTFTTDSTIRCTHCHAGGITTIGSVGSRLPAHASANRGILLAPYRDRVLKGPDEGYRPDDFALCLLCHTDTPFGPGGSTEATNFGLHSKHMTTIAGEGDDPSTSIDTPGAGKGDAICAECHFRLHSTALATSGKQNTRLVNFAPNVTAKGGVLTWTRGATGSGSCTLVCHGKDHEDETYGQ